MVCLKAVTTRYGILREHDDALAFARINRQLIALRIMQQVKPPEVRFWMWRITLLARAKSAIKQGWLHRKGATPDDNGLVIIPGSRGDYSRWLNLLRTKKTLHSLAHGAGRKWGRTECKGVWQRNTRRRNSRGLNLAVG